MDTRLNIIVVEDHELAREQLCLYLNNQGWRAVGVDCGEELNRELSGQTFHVAILDLNLPHEDGLSIAERLKLSHPNMGIVMLTARTRSVDRLDGYQSGADVYLHKPVNVDELQAVISNLARRLNIAPKPQGLLLRVGRMCITGPSGEVCRLTQSEALLLQLLSSMPGRQADTDFLIDALPRKEENAITRENLAVMVSRLRAKVQQAALDDNLVSAVRGFGYRLNTAMQVEP